MVTVRQSGGDYSSVLAAVVANETDITIDEAWTVAETLVFGEILVIDDGNPTTITVSGAAKTIGRPHDGSETTYRLRKTTVGGVIFEMRDHVTLVGVDVQHQGGFANVEIFELENFANNKTVTLTDSVLGHANPTAGAALMVSGSTAQWHVLATSCVFYGGADGIVYHQKGDDTGTLSTFEFNSCIGFDIGDGTHGAVHIATNSDSDIVNIFNCAFGLNTATVGVVSAGSGTSDTTTVANSKTNSDAWSDGGTPTVTASTLGATFTDTTSPGAGDFVICEDVTTSPYDLRLQDSADNDAKDAHTSSTGAGLSMPSSDIIGTSRPQGGLFDLGPFEIVFGGLPPAYGSDGGVGTLPPAYGIAGSGTLPPAYPPVNP